MPSSAVLTNKEPMVVWVLAAPRSPPELLSQQYSQALALARGHSAPHALHLQPAATAAAGAAAAHVPLGDECHQAARLCSSHHADGCLPLHNFIRIHTRLGGSCRQEGQDRQGEVGQRWGGQGDVGRRG